MDLVYENLGWAKTYCRKQIKKLEQELATLPDGSISRKRIKGKPYYYHKVNGKEYLIKRGQERLRDDLARAHYIRNVLEIHKKNHSAVSMCLKRYKPWDPEAVLEGLPERIRALPRSSFYPRAAKGAKADFLEGAKVHRTVAGGKVRSKSEALIIGVFEKYRVQYEYEPEVWLDGHCFHLDFKLICLRDSRTMYWEHFGRNDNPDYRKQTASKIALYADNGIVLWDNFIATFDNESGAIDMMQIERILRAFVL